MMYRLKLVVADSDQDYLKGLCSFLSEEHPKNIRVFSFTRKESLKEHLLSGERIDVLLVSPDLSCSCDSGQNVGITVILSESGVCLTGEHPSVNKYQSGDSLLGQVLDLYFQGVSGAESIYGNGSDTRIVAVYSPCGGAGKSTIAVNLAAQASLLGNSVFYLNLEPYSSSQYMLVSQGQKCLSNIFLYLNEESLLPEKIRSFKVRDMKYNVDFFLPPESAAELSGLDREATGSLLQGMRRVGLYDLVVIDIDPPLSEKNISVLENCDGILLLATPDRICRYKMGILPGELKKAGLDIDHKTITVINRDRGEAGIYSGEADFRLPRVDDVVLMNERTGFMEFNSYYAGHILSLARMVLGPRLLSVRSGRIEE
ncbi:MAG TPA: hypothetical protein DEF36_16950 [Desulfotomaculum sp.]|nr:hypothetical protein [Desulfotomaculum sp.]